MGMLQRQQTWGSAVGLAAPITIGNPAGLIVTVSGVLTGIKEVADKIWLVSFMHYDLGFFDHEAGRVECAPNPFGAKVLPMSPE